MGRVGSGFTDKSETATPPPPHTTIIRLYMKVTDSVAAIICHLVYTMYNVPYIHINTFVGVNKYINRVNDW